MFTDCHESYTEQSVGKYDLYEGGWGVGAGGWWCGLFGYPDSEGKIRGIGNM